MKTLIMVFLLAVGFSTYGQKLPTTQQASLRAPANIKIDGKADDWNNKFEAENPTTELRYTVANDDKKLYLIAQTNVELVINRIINGGIKLIIQKNGTKNDAGGAVVKFPFIEKGKAVTLTFKNDTRTIQIGNSYRYERLPEPATKEEAEKVADSLMKDNNKKLAASVKLIYTAGIAGMDSLMAIYNDKGIEVANAVDNKKNYTCEIAIELKQLGLSAAKGDNFSYHLVVNGEPNKYSPQMPYITSSRAADGTEGSAEEIRTANEKIQIRFAPRIATTDLWGEYTLAK